MNQHTVRTDGKDVMVIQLLCPKYMEQQDGDTSGLIYSREVIKSIRARTGAEIHTVGLKELGYYNASLSDPPYTLAGRHFIFEQTTEQMYVQRSKALRRYIDHYRPTKDNVRGHSIHTAILSCDERKGPLYQVSIMICVLYI